MIRRGVDAHFQNLTTNAVLLILNSTRATDIPNILKQLGDAQQDHLMAYLYKGMAAVGQPGAQGDTSGSVLLNWHEKVSPGSDLSYNASARGCRA